jgi:hypothetical protein
MIRQKHKLASAEASIESLTETVHELKGMLTQLLIANNITPEKPSRVNGARRSLQLRMVGKWLDRPQDARTTTDPYVRLVRPKLDPSWMYDESFWVAELSIIWQSEVKRKSLMPEWVETVIDLDLLGGHGLVDEEEELVIQVFDWHRMPPHDVIGTQRISIGSLLHGEGKSLSLSNTVKKGGRAGLVVITKATVVNTSELKHHGAKLRADVEDASSPA